MAEKEKRRRTLNEEEMDKIVEIFIEDHKDKKDKDIVDPVLLSKKYNISLPLVDKVYIKAVLRGAPRLDLSRPYKVKTKSEDPFINKRGSMMLGKSIIQSLNEDLDDNSKFNPGDKFKATLDNGSIVLTKI